MWNLYRNLFGLSVNVVLNFILINKYGVIGVAFATLISLACAFWLFDISFKPLRYMFIEKLKAFNFIRLLNIPYLKRLGAGF
jgi:O-antigen/teichoic acid export membrane protein